MLTGKYVNWCLSIVDFKHEILWKKSAYQTSISSIIRVTNTDYNLKFLNHFAVWYMHILVVGYECDLCDHREASYHLGCFTFQFAKIYTIVSVTVSLSISWFFLLSIFLALKFRFLFMTISVCCSAAFLAE